MNRSEFLGGLGVLGVSCFLDAGNVFASGDHTSAFSKKLRPVGRALETEGQYVWCSSPIYGPEGKVHVFFSHWEAKRGMGGWINASRISHAVAESPDQPFTVVGSVLEPRPGYWDATTCHNPLIKQFGSKYYLYYMGNSNGKTDTKRIGLAVADSLYGPWLRPDKPLLEPGAPGTWEDHCTTNPAVVRHPDGRYYMFYKSWNTHDYETDPPPIRGNRKYGLSIADRPEGPYVKYKGNPVIDFSSRGNNTQLEDAYVWMDGKKIHMIARDMGVFNHENGIIMDSKDGIRWSEPKIAYYEAKKYIDQPPAPKNLTKYGRFERPQVLLKNGRPDYLFTTSQGGKFMTSSTFIFKIN